MSRAASAGTGAMFLAFTKARNRELGEKVICSSLSQDLACYFVKNSDKVYKIRRIREHLVDYELKAK